MRGEESGARKGAEGVAHDEMRRETRPIAMPEAQCDVDILAREIDELVLALQANGKRRPRHLKCAEPGREPVCRHGDGTRDGEHAFRFLPHGAECLLHRVEGARQQRRDACADIGEPHAAAGSEEELMANAFLKQTHLIADGRLRHAEFFGGACKMPVTCRSLEGADGGKGR